MLALSEVHAEAAGWAVYFYSRVPQIRRTTEDPDYQVGDEGQSPRNGVFDIKVRHYLSEAEPQRPSREACAAGLSIGALLRCCCYPHRSY